MKVSVHDFIEKAKHFMGQRYVWGGGHGKTLKGAGGVD